MIKTVRHPAKSTRAVVHFEARIKVQSNGTEVRKSERNTLYLKGSNNQPVATDWVTPETFGKLVEKTACNNVLDAIATKCATQWALFNLVVEPCGGAKSGCHPLEHSKNNTWWEEA